MDSASSSVSSDRNREMEALVEELRNYDRNRGLEHQDIADNIRALRNELTELADFLHRTPPPAPAPVIIQQTVPAPEPAPVVEAPAPPSEPAEEIHYLQPDDFKVTLSRGTSRSSTISFLSSHHSDDEILNEAPSVLMDEEQSDGWSITSSEVTESTTTISTSAVTTSVTPSAVPTRASTATARQEPPAIQIPDYLPQLNDIIKHMDELGQGQEAVLRLIDQLNKREIPDQTKGLAERLVRIEDLVKNLIDVQGHPRAAVPNVQQIFIPQPSEPRSGSVTDSSSSQDRLRDIDRLRQILQGITPAEPTREAPPPSHVPPLHSHLDDILTMAPPVVANIAVQGPPPLIPFVYKPAERQSGTESPLTIEDLPPRSWSEPRLPHLEPRLQVHREHIRKSSGRAPRPARRVPSDASTMMSDRERFAPVGRRPSEPQQPQPPIQPQEQQPHWSTLPPQPPQPPIQYTQVPPSTTPTPGPGFPVAQPTGAPRPPPQDRFHIGPGPVPQPIFVRDDLLVIGNHTNAFVIQPPGGLYEDGPLPPARAPSAPPDPNRSWYVAPPPKEARKTGRTKVQIR